MEIALTFIGLLLAGLFIGVASGLLGIGGGTVMVPLLRLVFGLDAYAAAATSLFTMVFTSFSGAVSHAKNKTCYPKLGIALGLGGAVTSAAGVQLAAVSPAWAIMVAAALVIFYSAYTMLRKAVKLPRNPDGQAHVSTGCQPADQTASAVQEPAGRDECDITRKKLVQGFGIGMLAGLFAGYVGIGGGFLMVPLMTAFLAVPMKKASGTSVIAIIILAAPGVISQMLLGNVDYLAGVMMAAGSIPGATLGAALVSRVNERQMRFIFAAFLFAAGVLLVANEAGVLG